jgi:hypothetical protein
MKIVLTYAGAFPEHEVAGILNALSSRPERIWMTRECVSDLFDATKPERTYQVGSAKPDRPGREEFAFNGIPVGIDPFAYSPDPKRIEIHMA